MRADWSGQLEVLVIEARALIGERRKLYKVGDSVTRANGEEFVKTKEGWRRVPKGRERSPEAQPEPPEGISKGVGSGKRPGKYSAPTVLSVKGYSDRDRETLPAALGRLKASKGAPVSDLDKETDDQQSPVDQRASVQALKNRSKWKGSAARVDQRSKK